MERGEDHICDTELQGVKRELQLIQDGEEFPAEACFHYDITYEDCERVFNLLRNAQEIANEVHRINKQWKEIDQIVGSLAEEINATNA
jgi:hypothetical protein